MHFKKVSILVIDDDPDVLTAVKLLLKPEVKEITVDKNPENIPSHLTKNPDIILLDMNFKSTLNTGNEGFYWLKKIKELKSDAAVIMITAYGDIDLAIRSLKEGAADFVVKPWHNDKLIEVLKETLRLKETKSKRTAKGEGSVCLELLGESEPMEEEVLEEVRVGASWCC